MSVVSVKARSFILALFIRDDGERFLLGDNGYDFKDSQLHFAANTIENDEVMKQGADGVMVAGQVRRASVQSFDGYVGDATMAKETIEQMRRDFIAFFLKGHHYRVIYVDCNRNAWQRKGGYLVDAPEVKELYQIHPDYHVGLNFEDVNYYSYDEDADGNEILANLVNVPVSTEAEGGLVWDEDGAVSEDAGDIYYDTAESSASGKSIAISDATEAPLASFKLDGETSQSDTPTPSAPVAVQTVTGENVVKICGKNLFDKSNSNLLLSNVYIGSSSLGTANGAYTAFIECSPNTTYTISKTAGARFICGTTTTLPGTGVAVDNRTADNTASQITLTTSSTAKYLVVFYFLSSADSGTQQAMLDSLQFEFGSTATAFEPYQGQSYTISLGSIELCKIGAYQDYIYKSDDKWYVHKAVGKVILDGVNKSFSDRYTTASSHYRFIYADQSIPNYTSGTVAQIYCNRLIGGTIGNTYNRVERIAYNDANNRLISYISSIEDSTLAAANTWLQSNPLDIVYILATPTDTEITNAALIAQLEAILSQGSTYAGTNNITTITPNEQGTLEVGYYTKYQPIVTGGGYVWEAGGAGGATIVVNNSIDNVNPIWKIYGPTSNPQLENSTTGEVIEYVGLIAEGQTLTIDMSEQTASLDGLNVISNVIGDYISLAPGANTLIYSVSGDAGASELGWSEIVG